MKNADSGLALRPEDAARELGMSATQVRNLMRLGKFSPPIGYAHKTTGSRWRYTVYRTMLDEYLHKGGTDTALVTEIREENKALADMVRASQEENRALRDLVGALLRKEVGP